MNFKTLALSAAVPFATATALFGSTMPATAAGLTTGDTLGIAYSVQLQQYPPSGAGVLPEIDIRFNIFGSSSFAPVNSAVGSGSYGNFEVNNNPAITTGGFRDWVAPISNTGFSTGPAYQILSFRLPEVPGNPAVLPISIPTITADQIEVGAYTTSGPGELTLADSGLPFLFIDSSLAPVSGLASDPGNLSFFLDRIENFTLATASPGFTDYSFDVFGDFVDDEGTYLGNGSLNGVIRVNNLTGGGDGIFVAVEQPPQVQVPEPTSILGLSLAMGFGALVSKKGLKKSKNS